MLRRTVEVGETLPGLFSAVLVAPVADTLVQDLSFDDADDRARRWVGERAGRRVHVLDSDGLVAAVFVSV